MLPTLRLGSLAIQSAGLIIIIGLYLGLILAEKRLARAIITPNTLYNIAFLGILSGILGARLLFIIEYMKLFISAPENIISLDTELLDPIGGGIVAGATIIFYAKKKKLPLWNILDSFTPTFAVFFISLGMAHLASGAAYGTPTSLPWGILLWGEMRHPTQIYETMLALIILILLWKRLGLQDLPGKTFLLFLTMTSGSQILVQLWRGDGALIIGGFRVTQVVAWIMMAIALIFLDRIMIQSEKAG